MSGQVVDRGHRALNPDSSASTRCIGALGRIRFAVTIKPTQADAKYLHEDQTAKSVTLAPAASAAFSHRGCQPRPVQLSPVAALWYLTATLGLAAPATRTLPADLPPISAAVSPNSAITALTFATLPDRASRCISSMRCSRPLRAAMSSSSFLIRNLPKPGSLCELVGL